MKRLRSCLAETNLRVSLGVQGSLEDPIVAALRGEGLAVRPRSLSESNPANHIRILFVRLFRSVQLRLTRV